MRFSLLYDQTMIKQVERTVECLKYFYTFLCFLVLPFCCKLLKLVRKKLMSRWMQGEPPKTTFLFKGFNMISPLDVLQFKQWSRNSSYIYSSFHWSELSSISVFHISKTFCGSSECFQTIVFHCASLKSKYYGF